MVEPVTTTLLVAVCVLAVTQFASFAASAIMRCPMPPPLEITVLPTNVLHYIRALQFINRTCTNARQTATVSISGPEGNAYCKVPTRPHQVYHKRSLSSENIALTSGVGSRYRCGTTQTRSDSTSSFRPLLPSGPLRSYSLALNKSLPLYQNYG